MTAGAAHDLRNLLFVVSAHAHRLLAAAEGGHPWLEDIRSIQEVPILSKLPLIGELFRNRTRNHRRSDIKVSITTHIIGDDEPVRGKP
jgi:hypothetical protein